MSLNSFSQTKEIDELRQIWLDEMFEFGDIVIKDIDWSATFVPYSITRTIRRPDGNGGYRAPESVYEQYESSFIRLLENLNLQTGSYTRESQVKDGNNREMTLSKSRIARGRYWIDFGKGETKIIDSKNNFETVGSYSFNDRINSYKNYDKAYDKYIKKNKIDKRRKKNARTIIWEEILKRYRK